MTLRFEAEVKQTPDGPFEKCLVIAEAFGGDFAASFRVIACEKLPVRLPRLFVTLSLRNDIDPKEVPGILRLLATSWEDNRPMAEEIRPLRNENGEIIGSCVRGYESTS